MQTERISADASKAIQGLASLDKKLARKGVRRALRAAAKPTLRAAVATAPVGETGQLQANVKLKSAGVKKGVFKMQVGIGKKWFTGPAFYGAFVAYGHRVGKRQLGDSRKLVEPNDWLTKAYDSTKSGAIDIFRDTITDFIEAN